MARLESVNMPEDELAATEHENEQVEPKTEQDSSAEAPEAAAKPAEQPAAEPAATTEEAPAAQRNSRASAGHESSSPAQPAAQSSAAAVAPDEQQQESATPAAAVEAPAEVTPPAQPAEAKHEQLQDAEHEHHAAHAEEHAAAVQHCEQVHHRSVHEAHEGHQQIKFSPQQQQHRGPVGASHRSIGLGTIYRSTDGRMLTFTKPPYTYKAKPYSRVDYSHSNNRLMKIAHDNQLLVSHLTVISRQVPSWTKDASAPPAPGNTASAAVNRRKKATVIAQENHALYQRLVAIRPSKDISRDTLDAEYRQNEVYRTNCAQFKTTGKAATAGRAAH